MNPNEPTRLLFPPQASEAAGQVDAIFWGLMIISGAIILLLLVIITNGIFRRHSDKTGIGGFLVRGRRWIEVTWMGVPFFIFLGLFAVGAWRYLKNQDAPEGSYTVYVVGRQWWWQSYYPNGYSEHNELHLPAGRPVRLVLSSDDVIHSLYVPAFRLKQDAVPGKSVQTALTPTEPGRYRLFCAEYCGTDHAIMAGWVTVLTPEDFAQWQRTHEGQPDLVQRGAGLFRQHGCSGCHAGSSTVVAPRLEGVYGTRVPLASGGFVKADLAYLRNSILLPSQAIVAGYADEMPSYQGVLDEEDLAALLAYLQHLGEEVPHG